ncbi:MAG: hypothetical protein A2283_08205 [Lentisphaerae bacterium RIFOXYA12_FULL_48_11]|nr:MAG: hypothetical protein A2283_08205 [Lentisphaerae bacterium RIFOXYA12_FULL_48_11]
MKRLHYALLVAGFAGCGWLLSGAVHEVGHAIVARGAGLDIVHIQPWALLGQAHVRLAGETTRSWYAAVDISGMLFTVLVGICGTVGASLLAQKWRAVSLSVWLFIPMMCQCLAWVALPVAIIFGASVSRDDVTNFMQHTGWHALAVLLIGLALVTSCAVVLRWAFKRGRTNQCFHATTESLA